MENTSSIISESFEKMVLKKFDKDYLQLLDESKDFTELNSDIEEFGLYLMSVSEEKGGMGLAKSDALNLIEMTGKYALPNVIYKKIVEEWIRIEFDIEYAFNLQNNFNQSLDTIVVVQSNESGKVAWINRENDEIELIISQINENNVKVYEDIAKRTILEIEKNSLAQVKSYPITELQAQYIVSLQVLSHSKFIVGLLKEVLKLTIEHAETRTQFGKQIISFQMIKNNIALMVEAIQQAEIITNKVIESFDQGKFNELSFMASKLKVIEAISLVVNYSHQIHAAMGYTEEHILHYYTRKLMALREDDGSEYEWATSLAKIVLEDEKNLWTVLTR